MEGNFGGNFFNLLLFKRNRGLVQNYVVSGFHLYSVSSPVSATVQITSHSPQTSPFNVFIALVSADP